MITKTTALVLRVAPFSKTSHIVTWLTKDHGRISTVIKGAMRPKSTFLGQYDLFYTCELLFYTRERNGLHIAKECTPLNTRAQFRDDWRASACASYMCEIVSRTASTGEHQPDLYELLTESLDFMVANGAKPQFLFWFELQLVQRLGLAPQLSRCPVCGATASSTTQPNQDSREHSRSRLFSSPRGGILCPNCVESHHHGSVKITPNTLAMLKNWQSASSPRSAFNTKCSHNQLLAFRELLGMFLSYHLELKLSARKIAMEMAIL